MTVQELLTFINGITNKEIAGNTLTPAQYNNYLLAGNLDYFKLKYGLPEDYQPGRPLPRQAWDITQKITDDLRKFKMMRGEVDGMPLSVDSDGKATIPSDYVHYSALYYKYMVNTAVCGTTTVRPKAVEVLTDAQWADRLDSQIKEPTKKYPVCRFMNTYIQFEPKDLAVVNFTYLRMPLTPVYGYTTVNDEPVYDSTTSVQVEYPEDCHMDIARMILGYIGIELREEQVQQYAETHKQMGV